MCGYVGKEIVDLAREIAAREHTLEELLRDALRWQQTHDLPGVATAAEASLVRTGDLGATGVFARVKRRALDHLAVEGLAEQVAYPV